MGSGSLGHWLVVIVVVLIVFGAGRFAQGDVGSCEGHPLQQPR
jgi:Sec-independent protein translocase protein TatA